jgi:hypothetical protein
MNHCFFFCHCVAVLLLDLRIMVAHYENLYEKVQVKEKKFCCKFGEANIAIMIFVLTVHRTGVVSTIRRVNFNYLRYKSYGLLKPLYCTVCFEIKLVQKYLKLDITYVYFR